MTNPSTTGYLDNPYLNEEPYLYSTAQHSFGMEANLIIKDRKKPIAAEVNRVITSGSKETAVEVQRTIKKDVSIGVEVARNLVNKSKSTGMEVNQIFSGVYKETACEVSRHINDRNKQIGAEALQRIFTQKPIASEITKVISEANSLGVEIERVMIKDHALGYEVQLILKKDSKLGFEVQARILDKLDYQALQSELVIFSEKEIGVETKRIIKDHLKQTAVQAKNYIVGTTNGFGFEVRMDKTFPHIECEGLGYLNQAYLSSSYLADGYCVPGPMEVSLFLKKEKEIGMEAKKVIESLYFVASQVGRQIKDHQYYIGMEVNRLRSSSNGMQIRLVLYNNYNLRVLYEFPSRGLTGGNWTSTSTAAGDFSVNNLNTDIVEQRWQSADGDKYVILTCDTQKTQGVPVDTLAILNHNITTSASIVFENSNFSDFSAIGESIPLSVTKNEDIYYIAPTFPNNQYRYWRLIISDTTNPDNYIRIGTIVFGSSTILQGESFVDTVRKRKIHFSDKVNTEGFTNVSNDRALKKAVNIDFQKLSYGRGNFKNLEYVFDFARTSLKCLWIPDSRNPSRFGVFGKLSSMPEETHLNNGDNADYVDFSMEVDESL